MFSMIAGARPAEQMDEAQAARAVQQMFDSIAPRYDLLNHVLSASVDRWWWVANGAEIQCDPGRSRGRRCWMCAAARAT